VRIKRASISDLDIDVMEDIRLLFTEGFGREQIQRKFSWKAFISFWEAALLFSWNALWLLYDDNETVVGLIGGSSLPDMLTEERIAAEVCWRTSSRIKGKGYGWELLIVFVQWALEEQKATRILTHRFMSNDSSADERFDEKIKSMGFKPTGWEYHMDTKE
jgi:RimJ/RimL family protein N-acetyltransferase